MTRGFVPPTYPTAGQSAAQPAGVTSGLACKVCQHSIAGLIFAQRCPGCGERVGRTLEGDQIRFADPAWTQRVATGVQLIVITFVSGFFLFSICFALIYLNHRADWPIWVMFAVADVIVAITSASLMFFTTPDPSGAGEKSYGFLRKLVRVATISLLLAFVAELLVTVFQLPSSAEVGLATLVISTLAIIINAVVLSATLNYARRLSRRLLERKVTERLGSLVVPVTALYLVVLGGMVGMTWLAYFKVASAPFELMQLIIGVAGIAGVIYQFKAIVALDNLRKALLSARQWALEN